MGFTQWPSLPLSVCPLALPTVGHISTSEITSGTQELVAALPSAVTKPTLSHTPTRSLSASLASLCRHSNYPTLVQSSFTPQNLLWLSAAFGVQLYLYAMPYSALCWLQFEKCSVAFCSCMSDLTLVRTTRFSHFALLSYLLLLCKPFWPSHISRAMCLVPVKKKPGEPSVPPPLLIYYYYDINM